MGNYQRIELEEQDHFFYIKVFDEYSDLTTPHLLMPFPYLPPQNKKAVEDRVREIGSLMAQGFNLPLEDKLRK